MAGDEDSRSQGPLSRASQEAVSVTDSFRFPEIGFCRTLVLMDPGKFLGELKRRNVYKVAVAYIVASWAMAQGIAQVFPVFDVPNWVIRLLVILIIIGFPIALAFSWAFELTPEGLKRTEDVDPTTPHTIRGAWIYIVLVSVAISLSLFFLGRYTGEKQALSVREDNKSIAVLPFTTLSDDRNDAFFADGVQDQILTNLSQVSDLRVISHTSVRQYKSGSERNVKEIARQLGVAYVVEGSVQRAQGMLRINAQLIDARTDTQVWGETYDKPAEDLFVVQSELAQAIAVQLQAKLSPEQKAAIEERPTQNLDAFPLYIQAKTVVESYLNVSDVHAALLHALDSLDEAIKLDPTFLSAYCLAARANDLLFFFDLDPSPNRVSLAKAAVDNALRLRRDSAETHFARGDFLFRCLRDYDGALAELAVARRGMPNSTPFYILDGYINRRRNHFDIAERDFSTAFALDPRNPNAYNLLSDTYVLERRFPEAIKVFDKLLASGEIMPIASFRRASHIQSGTGDLKPLRAVLAKYPDMEIAGGQTPARVWIAMVDHDYARAEKYLADSPLTDFQDIDFTFYFPKSWYQGMVLREKGDAAGAAAAYRECREILAQRLIVKPEHARTIAVLAQVDASLGQKDLALQEAQRAIDLMPVTKDIYDGALVLEGLAQVYTWTGDNDHAIETVQKLLSMPGYVNYGRMKAHPLWAPLRKDPRFQKLVADRAPSAR